MIKRFQQMFSSRFIWKIYISYISVILLSSIILGGLVTNWMNQFTLDEIQKNLQTQALLISALTQEHPGGPNSELQEHIKGLGVKIGSRLTIIGNNGVVIADSMEDPTHMDNHANRPEILSARSHGEGVSRRYSKTLKTEMIYFAIPIFNKKNISRYVRTSISLQKIDQRQSRLISVVALGAGIAVVVSLVLGYFLAIHFSRPIESMTLLAESMSRGEYDVKIGEKRNDEIGKLAKAFNKMADSLGERINTISGEKNKLEAILAGMVEGVIAVGNDERVIHINKAACRITGVTQTEGVNKPLWEPLNLQPLHQILSRVIETKSEAAERIALPGHNRKRTIEVVAAPTFDIQGRLSAVIIVLNDISDVQALETVRRDFIANVSHELKTPVTAIRALAETIINDNQMPKADSERFVTEIYKQSIRLSTLVSDVLTLARLESPKVNIDFERFDLQNIIYASMEAFSSEKEKRNITIDYNLPESSVEILGDNEAMLEAVSNLLDNAIKYSAEGGKVIISLKLLPGNAVIEVRDNGIGIGPEHCERIFERFYRVDKARSRELGGTGLGLSIVKHVALSHGGAVEVESKPLVGSLFRIILPV